MIPTHDAKTSVDNYDTKNGTITIIQKFTVDTTYSQPTKLTLYTMDTIYF